MTDFKAKMHQIRFRLGLRPRPRWGSLQHSPRPPSWIWGPTSKEREREGREGEGGEGRVGERRGREEREGEGKEKAMSPPTIWRKFTPMCEGNYSTTSNNMKSVHWPLMGGLLNLVQR